MSKVVIFLLMLASTPFFGVGQANYDVCQNALELCPNELISVNNVNANRTFCVNCEDDFAFCFTADNTIWFTFTTNAVGGAVQIDFSNLVFEINAGQDTELQAALFEAVTPCSANTYTQIGSCHSNETANFAITAAGLLPNTTYYIVVDGDQNGAGITDPAECTFDLLLSGAAVNRIQPTSSVSPNSTVVCANDIVTFTCALTDCPDTSAFTWFINGVLAATTSVASFQTSELQNGDVVSVSNACYAICPIEVQSTSAAVTVNSVVVNAGADVTIQSGTTLQLLGSTNGTTYSWSPPFLVSNPSLLTPFTSPTETTVYSLTAELNGCSATDYVVVTIEEGLEIPNTFSPNGDQINDAWEIDGLEAYPDNQMAVFTRWGQKVFQTSAYSKLKQWDGENHAEGVYYYVLDLNDEDETQYRGTITIIR